MHPDKYQSAVRLRKGETSSGYMCAVADRPRHQGKLKAGKKIWSDVIESEAEAKLNKRQDSMKVETE